MNVDSQRCRTRVWFSAMVPIGVLLGMGASAFAQTGGVATGGATPTGSASSQTSNPSQSEVSPSTFAATPRGLSAASAHVIFSVDRVFGFSGWKETSSIDVGPTHTDDDSSGTGLNLLWGSPGSNPYATPRLSVDAVVGPGITLGGSVGYVAARGSSQSTTTRSIPTSGTPVVTNQDLPKFDAFVFTPRVGGVIPLGDYASIWLRGGMTYYHSTNVATVQDTSTMPATTFTRTSTFSLTALTFDPEIVFLPAPHFGLTLGAVTDIALSGGLNVQESEAPSGIPPALNWDEKISDYGVTAGVLGFF